MCRFKLLRPRLGLIFLRKFLPLASTVALLQTALIDSELAMEAVRGAEHTDVAHVDRFAMRPVATCRRASKHLLVSITLYIISMYINVYYIMYLCTILYYIYMTYYI